jgi:hypothetical protein
MLDHKTYPMHIAILLLILFAPLSAAESAIRGIWKFNAVTTVDENFNVFSANFPGKSKEDMIAQYATRNETIEIGESKIVHIMGNTKYDYEITDHWDDINEYYYIKTKSVDGLGNEKTKVFIFNIRGNKMDFINIVNKIIMNTSYDKTQR